LNDGPEKNKKYQRQEYENCGLHILKTIWATKTRRNA
jgi:hypothetical protein